MDVPRAFDLGNHDHVELVADLADERGEVVEDPRGLQRVDAGPQLGVAEVELLADLHEPGAGRFLIVGGDGVLEIAENDVRLGDRVGQLSDHLLVRGVEEMDHPRRREWDLPERLGGAGGKGFEEISWASHRSEPYRCIRSGA